MRIKWPDLKLPPINLWNMPKMDTEKKVVEGEIMADYECRVRKAEVKTEEGMRSFSHYIFMEVLWTGDLLFAAELFEIDGVECSATEAEEMLGTDNFNLAMEMASDE